MSFLATLVRMLTVAVLAAGLGLPAASAQRAVTGAPAVLHCYVGTANVTPIPWGETCRHHCLGATLLVAPALPVTHVGRATSVAAASLDEDGPSLWPQPERHPPRV